MKYLLPILRYIHMKRFTQIVIILLLGTLVSSVVLSGCATKRDCRGRIKHRLPNGVWM
jgi:predicted small secreted protein